ncbi:hypothetical protein EMCG_09270 [[Emmonsia] crescens]|uniref:Uncharacterized protein n=1 Tax=[Emmonsia] crescens TaxID=73230 RepID=A0A0G2I366_9EURO|nr:hypothetical protein EMCG_09270 [Emmonsia crescens UAMH 3008]
MGTAKTKKNDSQQHGGSQQSVPPIPTFSKARFQQETSFLRPVADGNSATVPASAPAPLRLPPIDPSRAQAPGRRLPPLFPRPGPINQPHKSTQPSSTSINNPLEIFPVIAQPTANRTHTLQSIYLREIEFHCICAARRFWEAHRPQPMLKLVVPNTARPSRPYGSDTPWRGINILTDPAFRDLQQPIANIFRAVNQAIRNDDGLGLREYLSLIADLDWGRVRQQQHQQQQQQLGKQGQQQLPPSGQPEPKTQPMLITTLRSPPPLTDNIVDTARQAYSPQFTSIQLLDDLYTWCEAVMDAVHRVNVGDGDTEPVELSLAELEGVVSAAKGLALSMNGTMENYAIGEVWAKCLQSRYP